MHTHRMDRIDNRSCSFCLVLCCFGLGLAVLEKGEVMDDKELLELAAKAAGIYLEWDGDPDMWQPMYYEGKTYYSFEPLTSDADAFRLAVKLKLIITFTDVAGSQVGAGQRCGDFSHEHLPITYFKQQQEQDASATRRAIVRAAAEIGKGIQ